MSTRGCIARLTKREPIEFSGVWCHLDCYPVGLGKSLFRLRNGLFNRDTEKMLKLLIDDHPMGWEILHGGDMECTCVNDLSAKPRSLDDLDASCKKLTHVYADAEFFYLFTDTTMIVRHLRDIIAEVDLNGPEPDWIEITQAAGGSWADSEWPRSYDRFDDWHVWYTRCVLGCYQLYHSAYDEEDDSDTVEPPDTRTL